MICQLYANFMPTLKIVVKEGRVRENGKQSIKRVRVLRYRGEAAR